MHMVDPGTWAWMGVWLIALFAMVWLLVAPPRQYHPESPADILRRRYAAGEMSEDEFRHARDVLGTGD
jgi:putative membrane protein